MSEVALLGRRSVRAPHPIIYTRLRSDTPFWRDRTYLPALSRKETGKLISPVGRRSLSTGICRSFG